ncbi:hypothetical protein GCM10010441_01160 [Kitasatospora paracochleata]|uniref:Uncharacterized protein n=1 Tax=Kitasatospora paracochleata TaxID=58354 RepID=A0ABT1J2V5_9ACTN|nr:hypothetical protein [Kitasatospora paracochleata]MCP2311762.1 hypothetical protein [Kitasatospora paracochleata]
MTPPADPVFVFDQDNDLTVFTSIEAAAGWMEAIDVDEGEYTAAFTCDGAVVSMSTANEAVILQRTDHVDREDLQRRIACYWEQERLGDMPAELPAVANLLLEGQHRSRRSFRQRITAWWQRDGECPDGTTGT